MTAALASLEDEAASAIFNEKLQQRGSRNMQIADGSFALETRGLIGPAAGNDGERRTEFARDFQLLGAQIGRNEPEDADTPGAVSHDAARLGKQLANLRAAQKRQRQKGQTAPLCNRVGKSSCIADPSHRALQHRKLRPVGARESGTRTERGVFGAPLPRGRQ